MNQTCNLVIYIFNIRVTIRYNNKAIRNMYCSHKVENVIRREGGVVVAEFFFEKNKRGDAY